MKTLQKKFKNYNRNNLIKKKPGKLKKTHKVHSTSCFCKANNKQNFCIHISTFNRHTQCIAMKRPLNFHSQLFPFHLARSQSLWVTLNKGFSLSSKWQRHTSIRHIALTMFGLMTVKKGFSLLLFTSIDVGAVVYYDVVVNLF